MHRLRESELRLRFYERLNQLQQAVDVLGCRLTLNDARLVLVRVGNKLFDGDVADGPPAKFLREVLEAGQAEFRGILSLALQILDLQGQIPGLRGQSWKSPLPVRDL